MMFVLRGENNNDAGKYGGKPRTLCDWVRCFRIKRLEMKRKLRSSGDLRVCAILSAALISAELKLKRKQQERFHRWLAFQNQLRTQPLNIPSNDAPNMHHNTYADSSNNNRSADKAESDEQNSKRNHCEYNSVRYYKDNSHSIDKIEEDHSDDDNCQKQQYDDEVANIWKCELVELDKFMRSISSNNRNDFLEKERASKKR